MMGFVIILGLLVLLQLVFLLSQFVSPTLILLVLSLHVFQVLVILLLLQLVWSLLLRCYIYLMPLQNKALLSIYWPYLPLPISFILHLCSRLPCEWSVIWSLVLQSIRWVLNDALKLLLRWLPSRSILVLTLVDQLLTSHSWSLSYTIILNWLISRLWFSFEDMFFMQHCMRKFFYELVFI